MTKFQELDEVLTTDCGVDAWSDHFVCSAESVLAQFASSDWMRLSSLWKDRPAEWQRRCADVLSSGAAHDAVSILLAMIQSDDDDVAIGAADSLRCLNDLPALSLSREILAILDKLSKKNRLNALVVRELERRLAGLAPGGLRFEER